MSIQWNEKNREFHLRNSFLSYIISLLPDGSVGLAHFGPPLSPDRSYPRLLRTESRAWSFRGDGQPDDFGLDFARREYPTPFRGDFRVPALTASDVRGAPLALDLRYAGHLVRPGKPALRELPATYVEDAAEAETLTVYLRSADCALEVDLHYTIFRDLPILARRATIRNAGSARVFLDRALSASVDFDDPDWDLVQFSGAWARERHVRRRRLGPGLQSVSSVRGHSGHEHNPAVALARPGTSEESGEVYGFALVYSGNFVAGAELSSHGETRVSIGINPENFRWSLDPGAGFETPETALSYSRSGFSALSDAYHRLFSKRLARGPWRDRERPVLLNNWEGTYFDFNEERLLGMARSAKDLGVELFVLDDGWFGERNDDTSSLGDWDSNPQKLPEGISGLARKIEAMGLKFGLWIEPEMVNPRSRLFAAHPDWAIGPMNGARTLCRNQYVLDLSRGEVVDHLYSVLSRLLRSAPVSYVKWDMNRSITEPVSSALSPERQGEFFHRYILGLYELYGRLTADFPEVLFESCSGGGGRFDPGLLAFAPQAWTSDDSDAIERLGIQWGSSFFYPASSMGAHVSASPNHQVGRAVPLGTRASVAFFGAFGYELDPDALSGADRAAIKEQISFFKEWRTVFQFGSFLRLRGPEDGDGNEVSWMSVSGDQSRAVVLFARVLARPNPPFGRLRLRGLDPERTYRVSARPSVPVPGEASARLNDGSRGGDELMSVGLLLGGDGWAGIPRGDFASWIFTLEAVT